ncbi:MAG: hypothetical protein JWS11_2976 [Cypionkella sp.]|nr:hypothetical protein [Cypionkella sp.]
MTSSPLPKRLRKSWNAAYVLKAMFAAQCMLAVLVALGDLPTDFLHTLPGSTPQSPSTEVPVTPGNQTRRFEPSRLPARQPTGPGFPSKEFVSPRLTFTRGEVSGRDGAILVTGAIAEGDARRFSEWLEGLENPPSAFALHSPGGSVVEALKIGRIIRASGIPVVVASGASCFSACPYVLAGGLTREVSRQASVGVHQHYFGENTYLPAFLLVSDIQVGQGEVMAYLDEMGVDPMLMAKALMTPPDDIYVLLPEELEDFKLSTLLTK